MSGLSSVPALLAESGAAQTSGGSTSLFDGKSLDGWTVQHGPQSAFYVQDGAIVVLHFDSLTTRDSTAEVLPAVIDDLRGAGYQLVTITELIAR